MFFPCIFPCKLTLRFSQEQVPKLKSWRKQTSLKIQFYSINCLPAWNNIKIQKSCTWLALLCSVCVCAILPIFSFCQLNLCAMLLNLPKAIHACHRHHFPDLFEPKWNCSMGILSPSHIFSLKYISRTRSRRLLCWGQWCWFDGIIHMNYEKRFKWK